MNTEWMARLAVRAYPAEVRAERGAEMAGAAVDAGAGSRWRFGREVLALAGHGLHRRAVDVARVGPRRLIADGLVRGGLWIMLLELVTLLPERFTDTDEDFLTGIPMLLLLGAAVVLAMARLDRPAGLLGLAWVAWRLPLLLDAVRHERLAGVVTSHALLAICCGVMLLAPRRRRLRGLVWLAVPAACVASLTYSFSVIVESSNPISRTTETELLLADLVQEVWLLALLLWLGWALIALPTDPRLAVTGSTPIVYLGLQHWGGTLLLLTAALPMLLALVAVRTRLLARAPTRA